MPKIPGPLQPWEIIPLLDGRPKISFRAPTMDLSTKDQLHSTYLVWLAYEYGYSLSHSFTFRSLDSRFYPSACEIELLRDDLQGSRERAFRTRSNFPGAGLGGSIPGLSVSTEGNFPGPSFRVSTEIVDDLSVLQRVLLRKAPGFGGLYYALFSALFLVAATWTVIGIIDGDSLEKALIKGSLSLVALLVPLGGLIGRKFQAPAIEQGAYVRYTPPGQKARWVRKRDLNGS